MAFRNDNHAGLARADALARQLAEREAELGRAKAEIERLCQRIPQIVVVDGPGRGARYHLDLQRMHVGRAANCEIQIAHGSLSNHHALFERHGDFGLRITDLSSAGDVRVNDRLISRPTEILPGDHVELGDLRLRIVGATEHFELDPSRRAKARRSARLALVLALAALLALGAAGVMAFLFVAR